MSFRKRMPDNHEVRPKKLMRLSRPRSPILHHWNDIFNALVTTDHDATIESFPIIDRSWDDDVVANFEGPIWNKVETERPSREPREAGE
jgi:hypothetical protein